MAQENTDILETAMRITFGKNLETKIFKKLVKSEIRLKFNVLIVLFVIERKH